MNKNPDIISFSRIIKAREYGLVAGVAAVIGVFTVCLSLQENDISQVWFLGAILLIAVAALLVTALLRVNISAYGVSLSLCGIPLKKICASQVHTITRTEIPARWETLVALSLFSVSAEEMEANGERRLRKNTLLKGELKFRENRSDWGDVCMGVGFYREPFPKFETPLGRWKSGIWMEFSPEREEILRNAFPQAQYRVPKRYSDPSSRN